MKHPSEATLALYAGRDLGFLARWRIRRHLDRCEQCRSEVDAFDEVRAVLPELGELPDVHWNRLAAEMKANIRLGLEAGSCVGTVTAPPRQPWFGGRAIVAYASIAALMCAGVLLERPAPHPTVASDDGVVLQATGNGIELKDGTQALSLRHGGSQDVTFITVGAQGSVRARYVDAETGYVTINNVYAQ